MIGRPAGGIAVATAGEREEKGEGDRGGAAGRFVEAAHQAMLGAGTCSGLELHRPGVT